MTSVIEDIERRFEEEEYFEDKRAAAEYAFVLAILLRDAKDIERARNYAQKCLALSVTLPARTLDDVTSDRQSIAGVPLPERFHDGVVRARLADLLTE